MIEDDGIGFVKDLNNTNGKLGLAALQSKIALMKGEFTLDKNFPQGSIITIYIPIETNDI
jgi:signal transduction histidine kinase